MLEGQIQTAAFWWKQTLAGAANRPSGFSLPAYSSDPLKALAWAASSDNLSLECHWLADIGREQGEVLGFLVGGNWFPHWLAVQIPPWRSKSGL